ncbi:MAG: hypothetical protein HQL56_09600 [Magnetococcales bacterium]|nr:hypothetical protein [Magnetococcales bacterium]
MTCTLILTRASLPDNPWADPGFRRCCAGEVRYFHLFEGVLATEGFPIHWPKGQRLVCGHDLNRIGDPAALPREAGVAGLYQLGRWLHDSDVIVALPHPGIPAADLPVGPKHLAIALPPTPDEAAMAALRLGVGLAGSGHRITLLHANPRSWLREMASFDSAGELLELLTPLHVNLRENLVAIVPSPVIILNL